MFLASKCLQLVGCSSFYARPGYSTPLPDHFPGFWRGSEQLLWCRSPHSRFSGFRVGFQVLVQKIPHETPPQITLKPILRCNFEFLVRDSTPELARNALYATHARFRAKFVVSFCAQGFHGFQQIWCKNEVGVNQHMSCISKTKPSGAVNFLYVH